jgi:rhomboid family GlyGly-CTERM serine protease
MKTKHLLFPPFNNLPLLSIAMGFCAALLFWLDGVNTVLQYDRVAIANGELWRPFTGHWTHWNFDHFLWCTIVFVILGSVCEHFCRTGYLVTLMAASFIIPAATWFIDPDMELYRGLSGLCSSIFIFGVVLVARLKYREKDWPGFILPLAAGLFLAGKIIFEFITNQALFVDGADLFSPAPLAHFIGITVGLVMALIVSWGQRDATLSK